MSSRGITVEVAGPAVAEWLDGRELGRVGPAVWLVEQHGDRAKFALTTVDSGADPDELARRAIDVVNRATAEKPARGLCRRADTLRLIVA